VHLVLTTLLESHSTDQLVPYPKDGCPKRTNINNEHWDKGTGNTDISNAMGLPNADYPIFYAFS